ncbi:hypothetical protein EUX98_g5115 [Antrodiella citrinella]|uniref:Peptidase C14 caspase domain-containing protein n=1 Tax=Antrodiella citrinella TaxID=2447956 RepID=A0A4S4MU76_9APHY|nr:hypothetical protein EUX98_g5115 [Antrodiella citrinella]
MPPIPVCIPRHDEPSFASLHALPRLHFGHAPFSEVRPELSPVALQIAVPPPTSLQPLDRPPARRALLIGINYEKATHDDEYSKLYTPQKDVKDFQKLLLSHVFGLREEDVVVMTDCRDAESHLYPKKANILRQIRKLVEGARSGDSFIFLYAGHSGQVKNRTGTEDDGMDEVIIPVDYKGMEREEVLIKDNELKEYLVNPIPIGARLLAVFDSCHSGTLLEVDLPHYKCNTFGTGVTRATFRRTGRRSSSGDIANKRSSGSSVRIYDKTGNSPMRKDSIDLVEMSPRDTLAHRVFVNNISRVNASPPFRTSPRGSQPLSDATPRMTPIRTTRSIPSLSLGEAAAVLSTDSTSEKQAEDIRSLAPLNTSVNTSVFEDLSIPRCSSPVPMTAQDPVCSGDCIPSPTLRPMVLSISACKDAQLTFEDTEGDTCSLIQASLHGLPSIRRTHRSSHQAIIEVLRNNPHPYIQQLMTDVSELLRQASRKRVEAYREEMKWLNARSKVKPDEEHVREAFYQECQMKYQDPQFGSHKPLNRQDRVVI